MTALEKLNNFTLNPKVEFLLTLEEFETLTPHNKGYCLYVQSSWLESLLDESALNEYEPLSKEYLAFLNGSYIGMLWAQDSEE
jgi:hypothetical protein